MGGVSILREFESMRMTEMLVWGRWIYSCGKCGCSYMGGTHGSCIVPSTYDVLEMCVMRGMRYVYGVCMCLARGGAGW